jgi:lipoprotein-anchoring transpeptidase ErfK/SrfK
MSFRLNARPPTTPLVGLLGLAAVSPILVSLPVGAVQPPPPVPAPSATPAAPKPAAQSTKQPSTMGKATSVAAPAQPSGSATPRTAALTGTREILLELGKRQISLLENGKPIRSWPVAIGDPATPTPTGRFQVENKVVNPQYQSTKSGKINPTLGAQGPLGDRWIGFKKSGLNQFGIHGTPSAWAWTVTSRAAVSNGCVRMLTPHVRELFEKVEVGTPVVVTR